MVRLSSDWTYCQVQGEHCQFAKCKLYVHIHSNNLCREQWIIFTLQVLAVSRTCKRAVGQETHWDWGSFVSQARSMQGSEQALRCSLESNFEDKTSAEVLVED